MRMHCPQCHAFLAVDAIHPGADFLCHQCRHRITPPLPNAAYFSCPHCGLARVLDAKHIGVLTRCSQCRTVSRVDSLHLPQTPSAADSPLLLPRQLQRHAERRTAPRHMLQDLRVYLGLVGGTADVRDISETGLGLLPPENDYATGDPLLATLTLPDQPALERLPLVIVRQTPDVLGCRFDIRDPALQRQVLQFLEQGLLAEQYLRDPVSLQFEKRPRLQLREHNLF